MHIQEYLDGIFDECCRRWDNEKFCYHKKIVDGIEKNILKNALIQTNQTKTKAADLLKIKRTNFLHRLHVTGLVEWSIEKKSNLAKTKKLFIVEVIKNALIACSFNVSNTARYLGIERGLLETQITRNGLDKFVRLNKNKLKYGKLADV